MNSIMNGGDQVLDYAWNQHPEFFVFTPAVAVGVLTILKDLKNKKIPGFAGLFSLAVGVVGLYQKFTGAL